MRKMPHYMLSDLHANLDGPADELGWKRWDLKRKIEIISTQYIEAIRNYQEAKTRGEILHSLKDVVQKSDETLTNAISILHVEAIQAMMGLFPNALAHYTDVESGDHLAWVTNDDDVMKAAFQSRMALQSQRGEPNLIRVEMNPTGHGVFGRGDEDIFRSCLIAIAEVDPDQIRQLAQDTIESLVKVFQFANEKDGRNTRILDGVRANADWQLYNLILDEVWPMENGELHSTRRKPILAILEAVMTYVWGDEKPKRGKGNRIWGKKGKPRTVDKTVLYDPALFSAVLTLRHQINSLSCALEIVNRRFAEIDAARETFDEAAGLLNALDRLALYPLRDWMNELRRRLQFGDYRPHNRSIRRPTGEIVRTPAMPKFRKATTEQERLHALIEAAAPLVGGVPASRSDKMLISKAFSGI